MTEPEPPSPLWDNKRSGAVVDRMVNNIVNGWMAAAISAATGSPEQGILYGAVTGPVAEELSYVLRTALGRQRAKISQMFDHASELSGRDPTALLAECMSSPDKMELLVRATEYAARSASDDKVRAISQLFAAGTLARDDARVDEHLVALDAIAVIERPHLRLLHLLKSASEVEWATAELNEELRFAWPEPRIIERDPGLSTTLPALLSKLEGAGMVRDDGIGRLDYQPLWILTPFGSLCIDAMLAIADQDSASSEQE